MAIEDTVAGQLFVLGGPAGLNGKDVYQLWLSYGNVGSFEAFLATLKGADGKDGTNGQDGLPGTGVITGTAAVVTGGHKVLYARPDGSGLSAASASDVTQAGRIAGISTSAALANKPILYVNDGAIDEPSWAFALGPVWLGQDGNVVQPAPTSGFVQVVGTAVTPTRIVVSIQTPFILAG